MKNTLSEFSQKAIKTIRAIPRGKVATYKQIALLAGNPRGSRSIVWILHACSAKYGLPWHRVLNSKGSISFAVHSFHYKTQKKLLEREGIVFIKEGRLNLAEFQWI